jgi:sugar/nucleoside kinase (ribokinase family)
VNFLSGNEMVLETATRLRAAFDGPIYADLHSLFLTPPGEGAREWRPLPDADAWLACFDAVQLNEWELGLLSGGRGPSEEVLAEILRRGPSLVLVTLGERGVRYAAPGGLPDQPLAWRGAAVGDEIRAGEVAPPLGPVEGDPTGCGDVWGGACFTGLLAGLPLERAIGRAELAAATKIRHPATAHLHDRLRETL